MQHGGPRLARMACRALSEEARSIVAPACPGPATLQDGVAAARQGNTTAAQEIQATATVRGDLARVRIDRGEVAGVPVEWVTPSQAGGAAGPASPSTSMEELPPPRGVLLYIFGGGFVCGSPHDDRAITAFLARRLHTRVCAPAYRLAPEHPHPAAREDIAAVYAALSSTREPARRLRGVVAESAGGNLALGTMLDVVEAVRGGERCVAPSAFPPVLALLSPWVDLTDPPGARASASAVTRASPLGGRETPVPIAGDDDPTMTVEDFLVPAGQMYVRGDAVKRIDRPALTAALSHPSVSPLLSPHLAGGPPGARLPRGFPPTYISTGTRDLLQRNAARLAAALRAAGVPVEYTSAADMWHVYEWAAHVPEAREGLERLCAFVETRGPGGEGSGSGSGSRVVP